MTSLREDGYQVEIMLPMSYFPVGSVGMHVRNSPDSCMNYVWETDGDVWPDWDDYDPSLWGVLVIAPCNMFVVPEIPYGTVTALIAMITGYFIGGKFAEGFWQISIAFVFLAVSFVFLSLFDKSVSGSRNFYPKITGIVTSIDKEECIKY